MRLLIFACTALFISTQVLAEKVIALPNKAVVGIGVDVSQVSKRVCYYQDQAYSLGAILQVGEHYLKCQAANDFETNGQLMWFELDSKQQETKSTHPDK
ncbi:DUF1496 domain-containing protein [Vibrio atypicus]|uniref:DUF1496 domain-containing protein n=1 Tax=Vibrio atypicus TaxID=558271 RepID=UPI00135B917A|nr:DUF1496 domain-containing protein [Vibrio atypicus]